MRIYHILTIDPALLDLARGLLEDYERRFTELETSMSKLSDKIAEVKTAFDAAVARNQQEDAQNKARIAELEAIADSGGATPEDMAELDNLKAIAEGLDATSPTTLPPQVAASTRRR